MQDARAFQSFVLSCQIRLLTPVQQQGHQLAKESQDLEAQNLCNNTFVLNIYADGTLNLTLTGLVQDEGQAHKHLTRSMSHHHVSACYTAVK